MVLHRYEYDLLCSQRLNQKSGPSHDRNCVGDHARASIMLLPMEKETDDRQTPRSCSQLIISDHGIKPESHHEDVTYALSNTSRLDWHLYSSSFLRTWHKRYKNTILFCVVKKPRNHLFKIPAVSWYV